MNSNKRHLYGLIITLFVVGMGLFFYRHLVLDVPITDTENVNSWVIEANLRFVAEKSVPVKASFTIPYMPPHFAILDEYFVAQNYGVTTNLNGNNRRAVWSLRRSTGRLQSLYYRAIFRETDNDEVYLPKPLKIKIQSLEENKQTAVNSIIAQSRQSSADIQTFAQSTIKELGKKDGNAKLLVGNDFSDIQVINAAILILNQAKIYAMPIHGINLSQQKKADFKVLLAVYNSK